MYAMIAYGTYLEKEHPGSVGPQLVWTQWRVEDLLPYRESEPP